jgi:hypothetical protein
VRSHHPHPRRMLSGLAAPFRRSWLRRVRGGEQRHKPRERRTGPRPTGGQVRWPWPG